MNAASDAGTTSGKLLSGADFDFPLPVDLIAQVPPPRRGDSRLLVVRRDQQSPAVSDGQFADLPGLIAPGDLLVLNETRVRHARLPGMRPGGGAAEVLLIHPLGDDTWLAMGRPGSAMRPGKTITLGDHAQVETLEVRPDGLRRIRFVGLDATEAIERYGLLPLPPYIERQADATDEDRYQTVFARREGSVAAPTAGLHFTEALLTDLSNRGVRTCTVDLEVGPGTFKPVEVENLAEHEMHVERYEIPESTAAAIAETRQAGGAIWAVGTTVVRTLESAATNEGEVRPGAGETSLMIIPGYRFKVIDHLITNFHLPRSTLLMLVSAFAGHDLTRAAYAHAVEARYRFYSYGDAMCIL